MYLSILGKHTDEELAKCPSVRLTSNHEETLLSLTSATLKDMGSQFGHVIHSMLTSLTLILTIKDYIQRGPSIHCNRDLP